MAWFEFREFCEGRAARLITSNCALVHTIFISKSRIHREDEEARAASSRYREIL